jgi:hypothetical protein
VDAMAFRIRNLLIAIRPMDEEGRLVGFANAVDECSRCTGLTPNCPGCSRVQCSEAPTRNYGRDFTIYEAIADFQAAERELLKAELKLTAQRNLAAGREADDDGKTEVDLKALEKQLSAALKDVKAQQKANAR